MSPRLQPIVVLHRAQLGENIGMAARAMGNCGLRELRLSAPRTHWNREKAQAAAAGAVTIIEGAQISENLPEALADCHRVFATSARRRNLVQRVIDPQTAAREIVAASGQVALLFGAESIGLDNEAISQADAIIEIPTHPDCASLNLSQAVLVVAYAWWQISGRAEVTVSEHHVAARAETEFLLARLEGLLVERGFFPDDNLRQVSWRNIRIMLNRGGYSAQEVRTWHGIFSALLR